MMMCYTSTYCAGYKRREESARGGLFMHTGIFLFCFVKSVDSSVHAS